MAIWPESEEKNNEKSVEKKDVNDGYSNSVDDRASCRMQPE